MVNLVADGLAVDPQPWVKNDLVIVGPADDPAHIRGEKDAIVAKADAHSLSASSYLRRLGLAMPVESTIDQRAILDLAKINADLGRFGGLIKMWLTTNADFKSVSAQGLQRKLENTLTDVRLLQKKMSDRDAAA